MRSPNAISAFIFVPVIHGKAIATRTSTPPTLAVDFSKQTLNIQADLQRGWTFVSVDMH